MLTKFEKEFGKNRNQWTKAQWRAVAESLAGQISVPAKRGRPKKQEGQPLPLDSALVNYQALAWQVQEAMTNGDYKQIKQAVKALMNESWEANRVTTPGYDKRQGIIDSKLETTYTEVRKILAALKNSG